MNTSSAPLHTLSNDCITLELDSRGCLQTFSNRKTGRNYASSLPLWRLYLQDGPEMDIELSPTTETIPTIHGDGSRLSLRHETLQWRGREVRIAVEIAAHLHGDEVHWTARIENREPGLVVRELHFPLIGNIQLPENQKLIWSKHGGEIVPDLRKELRQRHTLYKAADYHHLVMALTYPSAAATNCFTLADESEGFYFGCHQFNGERMLHQFRLYPDDTIEAGMVCFPNTGSGEITEKGPFVLSPYCGSWHVAARKYRAWANAWFRPVTPPAWVKQMTGWQRIILQHQYGEIHYDFPQLPQIHADGDRCGINTLFMFGWHRGGHDNNYPEYTPDPRLGSEEALRQGITHFNTRGGQVILYANGRLMDRSSDYFRRIGHKLAIHDFNGNEVVETYRFKGTGQFVGEFANRTLVPVCPTCSEWFDVLRDLADRAIEWNCRSLFLDQSGTTEYPCCNPAHSHPPLKMDLMLPKAATLQRLRDYLQSRNPEMALGIEILSDITAQHADYVHNLAGGCDVPAGWETTGLKPVPRAFIDWFRYAFPEVILSDREIRDDTDIERRVNHAVLKGLRTDVEIYRCRRTLAETPHYGAYLTQINHLRQKHADLLLEGRYIDTDGFHWDNPEIDARAFENGKRTAIVLTQSHLPSAETRVTLDQAGALVEHSVVGEATVASNSQTGEITITLSRHALVVLIVA